ncbi:MAG: aspartyl protease family protein [Candidatus Eremiobacteraeota bacterium]|nr:aspartyl protease family protein [Candidatus Eremiobacteraeota bacterium]
MNRAALIAAALFAFSLMCGKAATADQKVDAPPPGIVPTTMTLSHLLDAHEKARGVLGAAARGSSREEWAFSDEGDPGTETIERTGSDYHSHIANGAFVEEYGQFLGTRWHKDYNGAVTTMEGTESDSFVIARMRLIEDAADPKNDAKVLGEVGDPKPAYVVEVRLPHQDDPEWIFYDKATYLIDRVETVSDDRRNVGTYDDYRTTAGLTEAWHIHSTDGRPEYDYDYVRHSFEPGAKIDPKEFAIPVDAGPMFTVPGTYAIPCKFIDGTLVVRVMINGRGLDFAVSSGMHDIVIDREVAKEMNLPTLGQLTQTPSGKPLEFMVRPEWLSVGNLNIHQPVMQAYDFYYYLGENMKVVGVLGYDFLRNAAIKMDFVNGSLFAIDPKTLDKAPNSTTFVYPVKLDDGYPMVAVQIGNGTSQRFMVDNDVDQTTIFGSFAEAHPDDVADTGHWGNYFVPYVHETSVGFKVRIQYSQIKHFMFGPADYGGFLVVVTNVPVGPENAPIDGIVGLDLMKYYDVTYDYAHNRILLDPNILYKASATPKS